jgi:hypothetical protein
VRVGYLRAVSSRVLFAAGTGAVLAAVVAIVALSGGDGSTEAADLDPACVKDWNDDEAALAYGRHNFNFHDYEAARVIHLSVPAGAQFGGDQTPCSVIFPSETLDPEPEAAGMTFLGGTWMTLSSVGFDDIKRAELQAEAAAAPNAAIDAQGRLSELDAGG